MTATFRIPSSESSIMACFDIDTIWSCGSSLYDIQRVTIYSVGLL